MCSNIDQIVFESTSLHKLVLTVFAFETSKIVSHAIRKRKEKKKGKVGGGIL